MCSWGGLHSPACHSPRERLSVPNPWLLGSQEDLPLGPLVEQQTSCPLFALQPSRGQSLNALLHGETRFVLFPYVASTEKIGVAAVNPILTWGFSGGFLANENPGGAVGALRANSQVGQSLMLLRAYCG